MDNEVMANDIEMEEWMELSPRQQDLAEDIAESVMEYGQFNKGYGADGSHYMDGSQNAFKSANIVCSNCIFFDDSANQCLVVSGNIDPEGICKLWIIPEEEFTETPEQERQEDMTEEVEKRNFNTKEREHLASTGAAMPDGSYPITNTTDLENAIRSWGRGGADPKVKEHIISRARSLGAMDMIPDNWKQSNKSSDWGSMFDPNVFQKVRL